MVLASTSDTTPLEALAQLADKVLEVAPLPASVAATKVTDPDTNQLAVEIQRLGMERSKQSHLYGQVPPCRRTFPQRSNKNTGPFS